MTVACMHELIACMQRSHGGGAAAAQEPADDGSMPASSATLECKLGVFAFTFERAEGLGGAGGGGEQDCL